jgi:hypothetical protein
MLDKKLLTFHSAVGIFIIEIYRFELLTNEFTIILKQYRITSYCNETPVLWIFLFIINDLSALGSKKYKARLLTYYSSLK